MAATPTISPRSEKGLNSQPSVAGEKKKESSSRLVIHDGGYTAVFTVDLYFSKRLALSGPLDSDGR